MVPEISRWCWKVNKMVLRHSKQDMENPAENIYLFKANTNKTLVRKIWYSEYKMDKNICRQNLFVISISNNIFHHILQPCDHNFPLPGADIITMTLGVMYDQRFIINIVICHKDLHRISKLFVVAFWQIVDNSTVQHHFMADTVE